MSGPLTGVTVIELQGIGPGPFCGMMLADMGADVIRIDRTIDKPSNVPSRQGRDLLARGRRSVAVDLKNPDGIETVLKLIGKADALIEGYRPGVMERLGLGPDICLGRNPKLVYGRMTGWGQEGPYANSAGHDINYIALAGALEPIGRRGGPPLPPLNLVGDFGGGGMLLAFGIACALLNVNRTGEGQVVDAAMVDGAATLMTFIHSMAHMGLWKPERGTNMLDTGAHFYDVYECADGKYVSVGPVETQFYTLLLQLIGLEGPEWDAQMDRARWPDLKVKIAEVFKRKTRDEWCAVLEYTDVCFAPVLSMAEAPFHPHNVHRGTFVESNGVVQPAPSPRFSRTPGAIGGPPSSPGQHTDEVLADFGMPTTEVERLRAAGAIR